MARACPDSSEHQLGPKPGQNALPSQGTLTLTLNDYIPSHLERVSLDMSPHFYAHLSDVEKN